MTSQYVKFIQFGCWNNMNVSKNKNVGCVRDVIELLNNYIQTQTQKPNFIAISGDNYYPDKTKSETDPEEKRNVIYRQQLEDGINLLPDDIPIFMVLGNHDLDTNVKKNKLYIENSNTVEPKNTCTIINLEMESLRNKPNVQYDFFKPMMMPNGTLILLIDTSIYEVGSDKYIECYKQFFALNEKNQDISNIDQLTIQRLKEYQESFILKGISTNATNIKNIIIIGHHPIVQIKDKDGIKPLSDIYTFFKPVLQTIFKTINNPSVNYFYLCSDLHLYQEGTVQLPTSDGNLMKIKQYIVGNGGTKLDKALPPGAMNEADYEDAHYVLEKEIAKCGFLECTLGENLPEFNPIFINSGGKRQPKKTKRRRTRRRRKYSRRIYRK